MKKSILFVLLSFPLLVTSQNYSGSKADINAILLNIQQFSKAVMSSDHDAISDVYTEDAKIFPSNKEIIHGREQIKNYWVLPKGLQISYHKIHPKEIKVIGNEAYDYGYYEGKTKKTDGTETSWKGKYVIVWKKINNQWKIYLDIWNRVKQ